MKKRYSIIFTLLFLAVWVQGGFAQAPYLVKNINPGSGNANPNWLNSLNGQLYFVAEDGTGYKRIFKSDGTDAGTISISSNIQADNLVLMNGTLFYSGSTPAAFLNTELWKTDGTEAGTSLVKEIRPGTTGASSGSSPSRLTVVGSTLFFRANNGVNGQELWKSDGTEAGTVMVKDINPGSGNGAPEYFTTVGNLLFFQANDGVHGNELWVSDGTEAGTFMLKDLKEGSNGSILTFLRNVGGKLYVNANSQLWISDGTEAGTTMLLNSNSEAMADINGMAFFASSGGMNIGPELWKSDGTVDGTVLVKDIHDGSVGSYPSGFVNVNGTAFFYANDGTSFGGGPELWKSDGTSEGTVRVKDIRPGDMGSNPGLMGQIDDIVYFSANDGNYGVELWKSDGTEEGTVMAGDINPSGDSNPSRIFKAGDIIYFMANDGTHGNELWAIGSQVTSARGKKNEWDTQVFPNPSDGILNVHTSAQQPELKVFSALGDVIHSQTINAPQTRIELPAVPSGIYFYSLTRDGEIIDEGKIIFK